MPAGLRVPAARLGGCCHRLLVDRPMITMWHLWACIRPVIALGITSRSRAERLLADALLNDFRSAIPTDNQHFQNSHR
jgi:hypothetical protein